MSGVDSRPQDKDGTEDTALEEVEQEKKVETNNNNNIRTHRNQKTVEMSDILIFCCSEYFWEFIDIPELIVSSPDPGGQPAEVAAEAHSGAPGHLQPRAGAAQEEDDRHQVPCNIYTIYRVFV